MGFNFFFLILTSVKITVEHLQSKVSHLKTDYVEINLIAK